MSTKRVSRVKVGFSTQPGTKWLEVRTAAQLRHFVREYGNPVGMRYSDEIVQVVASRPNADELALSNSIPTSQTMGLLSTKSGAGAPTGTDAAPMAFVVTNRHDGTNAVKVDTTAEDPRYWGKMVAADDLPMYQAGGEQQGMMESIRQMIREATFALDVQENVKVGYNGPNGTRWFICDTPRKYHRIVRFLGMPAHVGTVEPKPGKDYRAGAKGIIGERSHLIPRTWGITHKGTETLRIGKNGAVEGQIVRTKTNVFVVDTSGEAVYTTQGRALRYGLPETWRDGTLKPESDKYLIKSERRKNAPELTQTDLYRATEDEMLEVERMTRNMARSRDLQRSRTRSDMGRVVDDSGRKPDGADMLDAMQDSVLYFADQLRWASTLTEAAFCINGVGFVQDGKKIPSPCNCRKPDGCRQAVAWSYIPARFRKEAEEADMAGIDYDLASKARILTRTGMKWTAARNAVKEHFTVQDAQIRKFLGKMLIQDKMGDIILDRMKEVEYEQMVDEGQPGYSWGMSLRTKSKGYKSGGTLAKPQYVGIAALRTSQDNPYSAETFQAAVDMAGGWDNLPLLREALTIGMNNPKVGEGGRTGVLTQMAASRMDGFMPSNRQVRNMSEQLEPEWEILRDALDVVRDLTDRHNQYEQGMAEGSDTK